MLLLFMPQLVTEDEHGVHGCMKMSIFVKIMITITTAAICYANVLDTI